MESVQESVEQGRNGVHHTHHQQYTGRSRDHGVVLDSIGTRALEQDMFDADGMEEEDQYLRRTRSDDERGLPTARLENSDNGHSSRHLRNTVHVQPC